MRLDEAPFFPRPPRLIFTRRPGPDAHVVVLAETVRFELTDPCESAVFKTAALDHSTTFPYLERQAGIEPAYPAWKAGVLPLNYCRMDGHLTRRTHVAARVDCDGARPRLFA